MAHDEAYYQAEKKIEEALKSGATELDLSYMRLSELPESFGQLTQLRELNLSVNKLTVLPEIIGQFTQLYFLNLTSNKLSELPESIHQLTELRLLWISDNNFLRFPEQICQFTLLEDLSVGGNNFGEIPDSSFTKLKNLQNLAFGFSGKSSSFKELPLAVRELKNLRTLKASFCGWSFLPDWIGDLSNLEEIKLTRNNIVDLPSSLAKLKHLNHFFLDGMACFSFCVQQK